MNINNYYKDKLKKGKKSLFYEISILIALIFIGSVIRTIFIAWNAQPFPNFEIIMVLTFLAAIFLKPTYAILVPLSSMVISDLLIGNPIFTKKE